MGLGNFASESEGGLEKNLKRVYAFTKEGTSLNKNGLENST